ncbi:MAG: AIR synthase-related protein [Thermoprotei archaeon]
MDTKTALLFAEAVLEEVEHSRKKPLTPFMREVIGLRSSGVKAGVFGVGSRGEGDFLVHSLIARIAHTANTHSKLKVVLEPIDHDDVGGVALDGSVIVGSIDGAHSRLGGYPFLMGFHAARAALRDVCVKGAKPLFIVDDIHLADDGDISKILEFVAGVAAVSEISGVPLVSGSTLRVGGDMVLGDRLVGAVGCVGYSDSGIATKNRVRVGDELIMTEGSGGGTITTTAIYSGQPDVAMETLNLDFFFAAEALRGAGLFRMVHAVTDVTNGGLRGDLQTTANSSSVKIVVDRGKINSLINPRVNTMLVKLGIDPLGLSLDSLLVFSPPNLTQRILTELSRVGVRAGVIGRVEKGEGCYIIERGVETPLTPLFRESPYTKLKKLVGAEPPERKKEMATLLELATRRALRKKARVVKRVLSRYRKQ